MTDRFHRSEHRAARWLACATFAIVVGALPAAFGSERVQPSPSVSAGHVRPVDPERDCGELVPESTSASGVTDDGREVTLDVLTVLDGITMRRGRELMTDAATAYAPFAVALEVRFKRVRFAHDGVEQTPGSTEPVPTADEQRLFKEMIDLVGGERPEGIDVVLLVTAKDIFWVEDGERGYGSAGVAYCIGGVRYPEKAFAISEGLSPWENRLNDPRFSAKAAAHEIGHLMGAHHHYGNCVEGTREFEGGDPSICTLMGLDVRFMSMKFGTLESAVIRGHTVDFASP